MASVIVFDLEFTAWPGSMEHRWLRPGEYREVVQIGAVRLDSASLEQTGTLNVLTKPRLNPVLSAYFEELTGITNAAMTVSGVDFVSAYRRFAEFAAGQPIVAFGRDDLVLQENVKLYGLADQVPPLPAYRNILPWLVEQGIDPRGRHACDIAGLAGADFTGRRHDALDDARSIALGIRTLVSRGAANPFLGRNTKRGHAR